MKTGNLRTKKFHDFGPFRTKRPVRWQALEFRWVMLSRADRAGSEYLRVWQKRSVAGFRQSEKVKNKLGQIKCQFLCLVKIFKNIVVLVLDSKYNSDGRAINLWSQNPFSEFICPWHQLIMSKMLLLQLDQQLWCFCYNNQLMIPGSMLGILCVW